MSSKAGMPAFARSALLLFLALRAGDLVNVAAGLWFVPRYVLPEDIGAVLPVSSFATSLALPVFAFAMVMMRESACLYAAGERGKVKSLLRGMFAVFAALLVAFLALAAVVVPRFLGAMHVSDASVGVLAVSAAFLGCLAPVYTDALQALKRFAPLAAVELGGSVVRFLVMLAVMPVKALAGYFAGQVALPLFRIAGSVLALHRDLAVPPSPYWNAAAARRIFLAFLAVVAYQATPMAASLVEQTLLRTSLPFEISAGYYMVSRFADFLHYLTFPLMLVMFPYTAEAAQQSRSTRPFVLKCSAVAVAAAAVMSVAYSLWGRELLGLVPTGDCYAEYVRYMPWLVLITVLTTCQVFYTNAEVSAGRYGFLCWLVPLHLAYPALLHLAVKGGYVCSLGGFLLCFGAASALRFGFAAVGLARGE